MKKSIINFLAGCLLALNSLSSLASPPANDDEWHFELKPLYVWLVEVDGTTNIPSQGSSPTTFAAPASTSSSESATGNYEKSELTGVFSFHFEAGKNDWALFTDYLYAEFTTDNIDTTPISSTGTNTLQVHIAELGAAYRVLRQQFLTLELLAGVRYMYLDNKFDFNSDLLSPISANANIWDGFGGIRLTGYFLDSFSASVRADAGGGTSDLVWNVLATVDWRYRDWGSVYAGYRVLDYDLSEEDLSVNLQGTGPVIGLGFYW